MGRISMRSTVIVAALALAGCAGSGLESSDPQGFKACDALDQSKSPTGDKVTNLIGGMLVAGEAASKATTKAIRDTSTPLLDEATIADMSAKGKPIKQQWTADAEKLKAACAEAGFKFKN